VIKIKQGCDMSAKKIKPANKFRYIPLISCQECGTVITEPGKCPKCQKSIFNYQLKVVNI